MRRPTGPRRAHALLAGAALAALLVVVTLAAGAGGPTPGGSTRAPSGAADRRSEPSGAAQSGRTGDQAATVGAAPRTAAAGRGGARFLLVRLRGPVRLRARPGGRVVRRLRARTEFGSPRALGVASTRGAWLGVVTSGLPNGRLGWLHRRDPALRLRRTAWSLHADLSRRTLALRRGGRTVRVARVAVGRPAHPTPVGRFAVTDKLIKLPAAYGCCALALSGRQPNLPAGWPGGDRLAVHGTPATATIGTAASTGCLRAGEADMRALLRLVPLGAPVFIRA